MGHPSPLTLDEIQPIFDGLLSGPLALAVSGGADSMALMHLVAAWRVAHGGVESLPLIVLTVDHGLRRESREEAEWVGQEAARLGFSHATLAWTDLKPASGLQAAARAARYRLMSEFLDREVRDGVLPSKRSIVTAHHADDQSETFLMRLARGSGLDGLSGMRQRETISAGCGAGATDAECTILRPLLHVPKARLVAMLQTRGIAWREDPSNTSQEFERVRVRQALELLSGLGISTAQIERSTRRLARAREAVAAGLAELMPRLVRLNGGLFAEIDTALFSRVPDEYGLRTLAFLLDAYGGMAAPARLSQIEVLAIQLREPRHRWAGTLGGCRIERDGDGPILIWREAGRDGLPEVNVQPGASVVWDKRFVVTLAADENGQARIRALGSEGVRALGANWPGQGYRHGSHVPGGAFETLPALWRDGSMVAVPYFESPGSRCCSARFVAARAFLEGAETAGMLTRG